MARFGDIVESMKSVLNRYDEEKEEEDRRKDEKDKRKRNKDKIWDVAKIIIGAAIGAVITWLIKNNKYP